MGEVFATENLARIRAVARRALPWFGRPPDEASPREGGHLTRRLSPLEADALALLAGGLLSARIAHLMGIAEATVAKHVLSARRKLGADTRAQAVAEAIRRHEIDL